MHNIREQVFSEEKDRVSRLLFQRRYKSIRPEYRRIESVQLL